MLPRFTAGFCLLLTAAARGPAQEVPLRFPGQRWGAADQSETAGYSSAKLAALCAWLAMQRTAALHVSVHGRVIFTYGDVSRVSNVASVRKSILAMHFDRQRQRKKNEMPVTKHPEHAMYLSTRDMARLGLLMLADGRWEDRQVMPKGWARQITTLVTPSSEIHPLGVGAHRTQIGRWGYGTLWWVWDAPVWPDTVTGPYQSAFSAMGAIGQYITVLPCWAWFSPTKWTLTRTADATSRRASFTPSWRW